MLLHRTGHVMTKLLKMDIRKGKKIFLGSLQSDTTDRHVTDASGGCTYLCVGEERNLKQRGNGPLKCSDCVGFEE